MNIPEHRKAIDKLDAQIVKLLNERTKHVLAIGEIKLKAGEEIYAPHRERAVLQRICRKNQGPMTNESLRAIYREIMSSALSLREVDDHRLPRAGGDLHPPGGHPRFGASLRYSPQKTIADVFTEVSKHRADYGVVPVENSTEGVVTHTLDMFVDSDLKIVAQIVLPVQHCLLANCPRSQIKKLYAHPQSLGQCRGWVQTNLPRVEIIETSSNARSAELAAKEKGAAAIAGIAGRRKIRRARAGIRHPGQRRQRHALSGAGPAVQSAHRRRPHQPDVQPRGQGGGAATTRWSPFRRYRINMTKIESRPSKRKAWEYFFFVDCDGHVEDRRVAKAIALLGEHCSYVKVLGSYPDSD